MPQTNCKAKTGYGIWPIKNVIREANQKLKCAHLRSHALALGLESISNGTLPSLIQINSILFMTKLVKKTKEQIKPKWIVNSKDQKRSCMA